MSQPPTIEQYSASKKQLIFSLTGELTSKIGSVIDEMVSQIAAFQKQMQFQNEETIRLKGILTKNNISFEKTPPKESISPPTTEKKVLK